MRTFKKIIKITCLTLAILLAIASVVGLILFGKTYQKNKNYMVNKLAYVEESISFQDDTFGNAVMTINFVNMTEKEIKTKLIFTLEWRSGSPISTRHFEATDVDVEIPEYNTEATKISSRTNYVCHATFYGVATVDISTNAYLYVFESNDKVWKNVGGIDGLVYPTENSGEYFMNNCEWIENIQNIAKVQTTSVDLLLDVDLIVLWSLFGLFTLSAGIWVILLLKNKQGSDAE